MEYLIQLFGAIPLSTVIIFFAALGFIGTMCYKMYKHLVKYHDEQQAKEEILQKIADDICCLKDKQTDIEEAVKEIKIVQKETIERQDLIEEENRKQKRNQLRDKLLQSYRYYTDEQKNPLLAWSEMEKESFDMLFADYESLGGNGYMHSTVQPAMGALEVVYMNNPNRLTELMKSRKG